MPATLLERYKNGEHGPVWDELRSHEVIAGELREEALAVAIETMKRVAHNVDLVSQRLQERGWEPLRDGYRTPPQPEDANIFAEIEKRTGSPVPVSLEAFWKVIGAVNFVWNYDSGKQAPKLGVDLQMNEMDPLFVYAPRVMKFIFDEWDEQDFPEEGEEEYFTLNLAPDYFHKADISGGSPYCIILPFTGADPIFLDEDHDLPFVDYLRLCFRLGGFSKLDKFEERADVRSFLQTMTADLQPF